MENVKKKETSMIDYVSSQEIKKNGDSDVSSAIKRVTWRVYDWQLCGGSGAE